jgi:hypothetical protein
MIVPAATVEGRRRQMAELLAEFEDDRQRERNLDFALAIREALDLNNRWAVLEAAHEALGHATFGIDEADGECAPCMIAAAEARMDWLRRTASERKFRACHRMMRLDGAVVEACGDVLDRPDSAPRRHESASRRTAGRTGADDRQRRRLSPAEWAVAWRTLDSCPGCREPGTGGKVCEPCAAGV